MNTDRTYRINKLPPGRRPRDWDDPLWAAAAPLRIDNFHPRSSDHRPVVEAGLLYDDAELHARFHVPDRYVRAAHVGYQAPVCRDSCVELFVRPTTSGGYFNIEINCGGSLLLYYVEDPRRTPDGGMARFTEVDAQIAGGIRILHSMPVRVDPEIEHPTNWQIQASVPFALFEHYTGDLGRRTGTKWTGNLYKCADNTSHPHWGSWSPVLDVLNFHQPDRFGLLEFAE